MNKTTIAATLTILFVREQQILTGYGWFVSSQIPKKEVRTEAYCTNHFDHNIRCEAGEPNFCPICGASVCKSTVVNTQMTFDEWVDEMSPTAKAKFQQIVSAHWADKINNRWFFLFNDSELDCRYATNDEGQANPNSIVISMNGDVAGALLEKRAKALGRRTQFAALARGLTTKLTDLSLEFGTFFAKG